MIDSILLIIFLGLLFNYLFFLWKVRVGLEKVTKQKSKSVNTPSVSVIIPFRNEADNILKNLMSLESQTYPLHKFEVIYVDDDSNDNSFELINEAPTNLNIKVLRIPEGFSPSSRKKRAIRFGIEHAEGEIIFGTDADCFYSPNWISEIISSYDDQTGFVSAPVKFSSNNNFFEDLQQLEFSGLVLTGGGLIGSNYPIICNAANISYRRAAFNQVLGFEDNLDLSSGDDEFLMQKIFRETDWKVKFCYSKDSVVTTSPNKSLTQFYNQRKRWASKGFFYKNKLLIFKLILIFLFYLSLISQPILGIFYDSIFLLSFLTSVIAKMYFEFLILNFGVPFLIDKLNLLDFLIAELLHPFYIIISGVSGVRGNFTWKERKIKR